MAEPTTTQPTKKRRGRPRKVSSTTPPKQPTLSDSLATQAPQPSSNAAKKNAIQSTLTARPLRGLPGQAAMMETVKEIQEKEKDNPTKYKPKEWETADGAPAWYSKVKDATLKHALFLATQVPMLRPAHAWKKEHQTAILKRLKHIRETRMADVVFCTHNLLLQSGRNPGSTALSRTCATLAAFVISWMALTTAPTEAPTLKNG